MQNVTIADVIQEIEAISDFKFLLNRRDVDLDRKVSIEAIKEPLPSVLTKLFEGEGLGFKVFKKQIILHGVANKLESTPKMPLPMKTSILLFQELVSGSVKDGNGQPLPGASIVEKGTANGTQSDFDGNFSLEVTNENATLVISYIGFAKKEIEVNGRTSFDIILEESAAGLDEVVVVGYGTQRKSDFTGALSSLKSDDLNPGTNVSVDQLLVGRAAGVQISQTSAEPGGGISIRVRGASSISAGNEPLYVIDGFPIDNSQGLSGSDPNTGMGTNVNPRNPLNTLNPQDVESIEILKDASATAIYGSRGANGVVLITTKKGSAQRLTVNYDESVGFQQVHNRINLLSASEYIDVINGIAVDNGNEPVFTQVDIQQIGAGTDWQDQIFRTAIIQNRNLSISGGSENSKFFVSLNQYNQDGVVKNTGIKKYIGRVNYESTLGNKVRMGLNLNTSHIKDKNSVDGVGFNYSSGPIFSALSYDPTEQVFDENGNFSESSQLTVNNPLSLVEGVLSENLTNRTLGNIYFQYEISNLLNAKLSFGSDRSNSRRDVYNSTLTVNGRAQGGVANVSTLERNSNLVEFTMNYNKKFGSESNLSVLAGATYQDFSVREFSGTIGGFPDDIIETNNLSLGDTGNDNLRSLKEENVLTSYLARFNYNLMDRYLFTATVRTDGSSRFGENNKFGYFPSAAFGWKLSNEVFVPDFFEELKLRASWGQTGNQEIGNYSSLLTFSSSTNAVFDNQPITTTRPSRISNPDLKWETTEQLNIGLDMSILKGRLRTSVDFFVKNTRDLLFDLPLPSASGFNSILSNVGKIQNKGFEALINSINVSSPDFMWTTAVNFSMIKNEVSDLGRIDEIPTGNIADIGNNAIIRRGEPLASYFGYEVTGIFQEGDDIANSPQPTAQPGFPIFRDADQDGTIDPDDQIILGDPFPDFTYGINNSFSYKGLTLDIFIQGQEGVELLNVNAIQSLYPGTFRLNRYAHQYLDRWTPQNTNTIWPSGTNPSSYGGGRVNSLVVEDASYIRLKSINISYQVPVDNIKFLSSLKLYLTGQNLLTITDYSGFDPEANSFGRNNTKVDYSSYPLASSWILGVNIGL
jgi:TonB-linked SusC/RagA family outer membrane protein